MNLRTCCLLLPYIPLCIPYGVVNTDVLYPFIMHVVIRVASAHFKTPLLRLANAVVCMYLASALNYVPAFGLSMLYHSFIRTYIYIMWYTAVMSVVFELTFGMTFLLPLNREQFVEFIIKCLMFTERIFLFETASNANTHMIGDQIDMMAMIRQAMYGNGVDDAFSNTIRYTYVEPTLHADDAFSDRDDMLDVFCRAHHHVDTTCSICMETDTGLFRTLTCEHIFHKNCIDVWFEQHTTCPMCRAHVIIRM